MVLINSLRRLAIRVRGKGVRRCLHSQTSFFRDRLILSEEVAQALDENRPVVALESTILTHGMPHPTNVKTAIQVESIVRARGAVPATIGVTSGYIRIGLSESELQFLGDPATDVVKISRRDFPHVLSQRRHGGTTVAGTMLVCSSASLPLFVTGGVGGVHRGAASTWDVSADLRELGRTRVCVLSSGVKSILDVGLTLEYLETEGVPVAVFGANDEFPAFFSSSSGLPSPNNVANAGNAARLVDTWWRSGLDNGMLLAVPFPSASDVNGEAIEEAIRVAVAEAQQQNVSGKDVTPFVLSRVNAITGGESLAANVALIKHNAAVGADIAVAWRDMKLKEDGETSPFFRVASLPSKDVSDAATGESTGRRPLVVGGVVSDVIGRFKDEEVLPNGATYEGNVFQAFGGVGRNVADALTRLGSSAAFVSVVGADFYGVEFRRYCSHMDVSRVEWVEGERTPTYLGLLSAIGDLIYGVGDMNLHSRLTPDLLLRHESVLMTAPLVVFDGNVAPEAMTFILKSCQNRGVPTWFEPTDVNKALKPFQMLKVDPTSPVPTFVSPNLNELRLMAQFFNSLDAAAPSITPPTEASSSFTALLAPILLPVLQRVPVVVVTLGADGFAIAFDAGSRDFVPTSWHSSLADDDADFVAVVFPLHLVEDLVPSPSSVVSVSGAGDCLAAAFIRGLLRGDDLLLTATVALAAAQTSLKSSHAVPRDLNDRIEEFEASWSSSSSWHQRIVPIAESKGIRFYLAENRDSETRNVGVKADMLTNNC